MTDWDNEADKAAKQTDKELAAGLDKLMAADLTALYPNEADRKRVQELVNAIKVQTDKNERIAAFKAIGATLGMDVIKLAKKAMLALALGLLAGLGVAHAQVTTLDLNNPLADPRAGFAWDAQGGRLGVAYVPVVYWVGASSGLEYATLNWGMSDTLANGHKAMLVSIGPRVDNIFTWLAGQGFSKRHLRFAGLPPVQAAVALVTADFKHYRPMLSLVTRFGGR